MLLVTTADPRLKDLGQARCYLGEWCRTFPDSADQAVPALPYHWNDRTRAAQDFSYLRGLFESALAAYAKKLNTLLEVQRSDRYWRILIGPWLSAFFDVTFDRYRCICMARDSGRVDQCQIPTSQRFRWADLDTSGFYGAAATDEFCRDLFGQIIRALKPFPYQEVPAASEPPQKVPRRCASAKVLLRDLCVSISHGVRPSRLMVMTSDVFSWKHSLRLHAALGALPFVSTAPKNYPDISPSEQRRSALKTFLGRSEFETLASELLPEFFPAIYLEGYSCLRATALRRFPRSARLIVTGAAQTGDEYFKCWTAEQLENGGRLAVVQHGGLYGTNAWCSHEYNEIHSTDRYFSWGWKDQSPNVAPLDAPKLIKIEEKIAPAPSGWLLMVLNAAPRYSYRHASWPISTQYLTYLADQIKFIKALSNEAAQILRVRPYPLERGWEAEQRLRARLPNLMLTGKQSMYEELNQSRLFIGTCNITTYLEALAANFPTVLFWNPRHWENRSGAVPYFEGLRHAGILFDDPVLAASHVNAIWDTPRDWWQTAPVQAARRDFVERFAKCSPNWLSNWVSALKQLAQP